MLPGDRQTVLVVDDNAELRGMMVAALASKGHPVLEATGGQDGLAKFLQYGERISFAIIEMVLPGMTGLDLAAELERKRPGFKILYVSSVGESIAAESIARRAADLVLIKPFTPAIFLTRVDRLVEELSAVSGPLSAKTALAES